MTDHPAPEAFALFTMGALDDEETFVAHVAGCDACSETLAREARLELALARVPAPRRARKLARVLVPLVAIAAAAAVLLGLRGAAHETIHADVPATTTAARPAVAAPAGSESVDTLNHRVTLCFKAGSARDPAMAGRVEIEATVETNGDVTRTAVVRNDGLPDDVAQCVASAVASTRLATRERSETTKLSFVYVRQTPQP